MPTFNPTAAQRANLEALASYLEALPRNYRHFDIDFYHLDEDNCQVGPEAFKEEWLLRKHCGSAACAIGHGPYAGIPLKDDFSWRDYAIRVFGTDNNDTEEGDFMFGTGNPNGVKRAAQRIRKVLAGKFKPDPERWGGDF